MFPNCQVQMSYNDPLLAPTRGNYSQYIESELQRVEEEKQRLLAARNSIQQQPTQQLPNAVNLWADIDREITALTPEQQNILANDEVYRNIDAQLQMLIQTELINSVKDKVANSEQGRALLEKQLSNIKDKKARIIEESNKDIELFKKFQIAAQANPNLTYVEFIKAITQNEVPANH